MNQDDRKTWLEVAVNGAWGRKRQPRIPIAVDEIVREAVECVKAGASIVHMHPYDVQTGRQKDDPEIYAEIISGIRAQCDAIVYPTLPFVHDGSPGERYAHVEELARRGLLEWAAVDPGSCNIALYDDLREDRDGFVYANSEEHLRHVLGLARRHRFHPAYAIYEPGFMRLGATLHWRCSCPAPIYRLMFSSGFTFGFPPEDYGLTAYLNLLDQVAPGAQWMLSGLSVDVLPLIPRVVAEGGHVRVGLEDAPFGSTLGNLDWVQRAVEAIGDAGGELATPADVRATMNAVEMGER